MFIKRQLLRRGFHFAEIISSDSINWKGNLI